MTKSIPLSYLSKVTPSVIAAGGTLAAITGMLLTNSTLVPIGTVASFESPALVGDLFGENSEEYSFAVDYFASYDGSTDAPAALLLAQYPVQSVAAYLQGGTLATALSVLQALTPGDIALNVNGALVTSGNINLSAANSYSAVAEAVQAALGYSDAQFTASIAGNVLTVTAVAAGLLGAGADIQGASIPAGVTILSQLTSTAGEGAQGTTGTYQISEVFPDAVAAEAMTAGTLKVTYDSQRDAFILTVGTPGTTDAISVANVGVMATGLKLTTATGAILSPGAVASVPATFMNALLRVNLGWVSFTTLFEPVAADKVAFAAWNNAQNGQYAYVAWSTDIVETEASDDTSAFYLIKTAGYGGVHYIYAPNNGFNMAAAIMGAAASIDFSAENGRITFAGLSFDTLPGADVFDEGIATILDQKGINYYGAFATAIGNLLSYQSGTVTGAFLWFDSYVNQIWLNANCQLAQAKMLQGGKSFPYNTDGYATVSEYLSDPIQAAISFGAIRTGITLSNAQIAQVKALVGSDVSQTLMSAGFVLIIQAASATVRAARTSPPMFLVYTDGQSIQRLALASVEVE